jgi:hypothetical protein
LPPFILLFPSRYAPQKRRRSRVAIEGGAKCARTRAQNVHTRSAQRAGDLRQEQRHGAQARWWRYFLLAPERSDFFLI